jgi:hypothetical protein
VAGRTVRRSSWSSESGRGLVTGHGTSRPSGSAAALTVRSRASACLVTVYRGGSRASEVCASSSEGAYRVPHPSFHTRGDVGFGRRLREHRPDGTFVGMRRFSTSVRSRADGRRGNAVRQSADGELEDKGFDRECPFRVLGSWETRFPVVGRSRSSGNGKKATAAVMRCGCRRGVLRRV